MDFIKKMMSAGLGAMIMTEEKINETIDELVKKGELSEKDGKSVLKDIMDRMEENKKFIEDKITEQFEKLFKKANIVTTEDFEKLEKRIEKLENLLREKNKESK
ncbi:MAG: hypothetical protein HY934_05350 [Candidatus Firestonebacteria bacterium]|nr:hypothetical protein [Candidatus Firestonebacteria bacterium]